MKGLQRHCPLHHPYPSPSLESKGTGLLQTCADAHAPLHLLTLATEHLQTPMSLASDPSPPPQGLYKIITTFIRAVPHMSNLVILILLTMFMFALLGMQVSPPEATCTCMLKCPPRASPRIFSPPHLPPLSCLAALRRDLHPRGWLLPPGVPGWHLCRRVAGEAALPLRLLRPCDDHNLHPSHRCVRTP